MPSHSYAARSHAGPCHHVLPPPRLPERAAPHQPAPPRRVAARIALQAGRGGWLYATSPFALQPRKSPGPWRGCSHTVPLTPPARREDRRQDVCTISSAGWGQLGNAESAGRPLGPAAGRIRSVYTERTGAPRGQGRGSDAPCGGCPVPGSPGSETTPGEPHDRARESAVFAYLLGEVARHLSARPPSLGRRPTAPVPGLRHPSAVARDGAGREN